MQGVDPNLTGVSVEEARRALGDARDRREAAVQALAVADAKVQLAELRLYATRCRPDGDTAGALAVKLTHSEAAVAAARAGGAA